MSSAAQLAQVALTVMAEASIKADDASLSAVLETRNFLRAIVDGRLHVAAPVKAQPCRGGDGVVPPEVFSGAT